MTLPSTPPPNKPLARNLRVVRLDDDQRRLSREAYSASAGDGIVMHPLHLITTTDGRNLLGGISGLASAETFWKTFNAEHLPDIVIGDINFEKDYTTPLKTAVSDPKIPTGLSHIKPLAAVSRAVSRPLAVAVYTGGPKHWRTFAESPIVSDKIIGCLAAHEVIELASILGEPIPRNDLTDLTPVWNWLMTRTETSPNAALVKALQLLRQQIINRMRRAVSGSDPLAIRIPIRDLPALRTWCQGMASQPVPLRKADIGIPLLYPDGQVDRISFASLFADVDNVLDGHLPPECFALTPNPGPTWELGRRGLPLIGALIGEMLAFERSAATAVCILRDLPISESPLTANLRTLAKNDALASGLAVLFRAMEIFCADETIWERIWREGPWDPCSLKEACEDVPTIGSQYSLEHWVNTASTVLREVAMQEHSDPLAFVDIELLTAKMPPREWESSGRRQLTKLGTEAITFHLNLLCEMGIAEHRYAPSFGPEYRLRTATVRGFRPFRPSHLSWLSSTLTKQLEDSLGFGTRGPGVVNPNGVPQILYEAFVPVLQDVKLSPSQKATAGREFLTQFEHGQAPGWIKDLCRAFALDNLDWVDERTWPPCIK